MQFAKPAQSWNSTHGNTACYTHRICGVVYAGTTLEVSNVYGSYHMYDYRLSKSDTAGGNVEVTSNMIEESVETVSKE